MTANVTRHADRNPPLGCANSVCPNIYSPTDYEIEKAVWITKCTSDVKGVLGLGSNKRQRTNCEVIFDERTQPLRRAIQEQNSSMYGEATNGGLSNQTLLMIGAAVGIGILLYIYL